MPFHSTCCCLVPPAIEGKYESKVAMIIELCPGQLEEITPLRVAMYQSLTAPLDGMWDEIIHGANLRTIRFGGAAVGYLTLGEEGSLYHFFLLKPFWNQQVKVMQEIIGRLGVTSAVINTHHPLFVDTALELFEKPRVHTYLYTDFVNKEIQKPPFIRSFRIDLMPPAERERLVEFYLENTGGSRPWLEDYLARQLQQQAITGMFDGNQLLGSLEIRLNKCRPHADIGLVISAAHRKNGLGTYLASEAKRICLAGGLKPICSCTANNLGSKRLIEKAGFVRTGSIIEMKVKQV